MLCASFKLSWQCRTSILNFNFQGVSFWPKARPRIRYNWFQCVNGMTTKMKSKNWKKNISFVVFVSFGAHDQTITVFIMTESYITSYCFDFGSRKKENIKFFCFRNEMFHLKIKFNKKMFFFVFNFVLSNFGLFLILKFEFSLFNGWIWIRVWGDYARFFF